ncbi:MAG: diphosphomevalonate decarboxylase [Flavobacteriaceae bacterium]|nr:diphosphomevalonate decarboxylase [Bacteroidia bacterium]NNF74439.1 diphosphomevalonate decarboxylase [Flavobacteriaceae bacterium]
MTESDFIPEGYSHQLEDGSVSWSSPSNIALVKYWGKHEPQMPANPSISFTLDSCRSDTKLSFSKRKHAGTDFSFDLIFEGKEQPDFKPKIATFFKRIERYLPFLTDYHLVIESSNSFPHSSGIASSASAFSALALCLMSMERKLDPDMSHEDFTRKASFLSRLGSGSACRSVEGGLVVWGDHDDIPGSSDLYGIPFPFEIHERFKSYHDTILLVDKGKKQVSSTLGHQLMVDHPFGEQRFKQANSNLALLTPILQIGDLQGFIHIVEQEALSLHAMMLTSNPYFMLMKPNTLNIINSVWEFRRETGHNLCFTLDAGANVHLLFPDAESDKIYEFIKNELVAYCENGHYICDNVGSGAKQTSD